MSSPSQAELDAAVAVLIKLAKTAEFLSKAREADAIASVLAALASRDARIAALTEALGKVTSLANGHASVGHVVNGQCDMCVAIINARALLDSERARAALAPTDEGRTS